MDARDDCPRCASTNTEFYRSLMHRNGTFGGPTELWCSECGLVFSIATESQGGSHARR